LDGRKPTDSITVPEPSMISGMAAKRKKPSGENIPEAQRHTVQVKLRLPPEYAERLDELARKLRVTRSGAVAHLLDAIEE
jgi:hypothetical protein